MRWNETTRRDYNKRFLRYTSDYTDEEWHLIAPFFRRAVFKFQDFSGGLYSNFKFTTA